MSTPLCPCGRPSTRPGDPCPTCQIRVMRALARGCVNLASGTTLKASEIARRIRLDALGLR